MDNDKSMKYICSRCIYFTKQSGTFVNCEADAVNEFLPQQLWLNNSIHVERVAGLCCFLYPLSCNRVQRQGLFFGLCFLAKYDIVYIIHCYILGGVG